MKRMREATSPMDRASQSMTDDQYMDIAIELAWRGAGRTRSNPLVGAVVVRDGEVVGQGHHVGYGLAHAEVMALDAAGVDVGSATLYVTLEPCVHHGKTPPCIERILKSGIARVVVSTLDPDGRVDGAGVSALREAGVAVDVGCRAESALLLNLARFRRALGHQSTVTLKLALTQDGCIASASGRRDAITGEETQEHVHRLRAEHDAVLIGIETMLVDRPRLDCRRLGDVQPPMPVVVDSKLRFPAVSFWNEAGRDFIICTCVEDTTRVKAARGRVLICRPSASGVDLGDVVGQLHGEGIDSILVEGGAKIFASFIRDKSWDAIHIFESQKKFGADGVRVADIPGDAVAVATRQIGEDVLTSHLKKSTRDALIKRLVR